MEQEGTKDVWDKLRAAAPMVASVLVPVAVAFIGSEYNRAIKDSENRVKYVEAALGVLTSKPTDETAALRTWAMDLLDKTAPVALSSEARAQLQRQALPHATLQGAVTLDDVRVSGGFVGSVPLLGKPQAAARAAQASSTAPAAPAAAPAPAPASVAAAAASAPRGGAVVGGVISLDGAAPPAQPEKRAP